MAHGFEVTLPEPDCPMGYSEELLKEKLPAVQYEHLMHWMRGQTMCICTGKAYNHEMKVEYETECLVAPHGNVLYPWDVKRWMDGRGPLD